MKELYICSASKLKKTQAWKTLSLLVRTEEKGKCFTCGKVNPIKKCHAGHFVQAGGHSGTIFDRKNVHCQCLNCNLYKSGNLLIYNDKMIELYGEEEVKALRRRANEYCKGYTKEQLKELNEFFKELLSRL
jgi:hypothetical protein